MRDTIEFREIYISIILFYKPIVSLIVSLGQFPPSRHSFITLGPGCSKRITVITLGPGCSKCTTVITLGPGCSKCITVITLGPGCVRAKLCVPARRCCFRGWVAGGRSVGGACVPRACPCLADQSGSHVIHRSARPQNESACQNVGDLDHKRSGPLPKRSSPEAVLYRCGPLP